MRVLLTLMLWLVAPLALAADPLSIPAITLVQLPTPEQSRTRTATGIAALATP